tara:strand:- start:582 stop:938 length:357 start_codon:yes stop_codon:yes gene_type:complete
MNLDNLPLFNHPVAPSNDTETSKEAAEFIKPKVNGLCLKVLRVISNHQNGLTCDEVEQITGMKHQTASARLNDLSKCQPPLLVHRLDEETNKPQKRATRSGSSARIYFISEFAKKCGY